MGQASRNTHPSELLCKSSEIHSEPQDESSEPPHTTRAAPRWPKGHACAARPRRPRRKGRPQGLQGTRPRAGASACTDDRAMAMNRQTTCHSQLDAHTTKMRRMTMNNDHQSKSSERPHTTRAAPRWPKGPRMRRAQGPAAETWPRAQGQQGTRPPAGAAASTGDRAMTMNPQGDARDRDLDDQHEMIRPHSNKIRSQHNCSPEDTATNPTRQCNTPTEHEDDACRVQNATHRTHHTL